MGDVVGDTAGAASAACRIGRYTPDALSYTLPSVAVSGTRLGGEPSCARRYRPRIAGAAACHCGIETPFLGSR